MCLEWYLVTNHATKYSLKSFFSAALFLFAVEDIVNGINKSLDTGTVDETHTLIQKREGLFPKVLTRSAFLYHDGLCKAKQALQVRELVLFTYT